MVGLLVLCALAVISPVQAQSIYDWFDTAPDGNWKQGASGARWTGGLWDEPPSGNILRFNNNAWLSMNNNVSSYSVHQLIFGSSGTSDRSIGGNALAVNDWGGADPKIENQSTGAHTISLNLTGDSNDPLEINAVSGDLTISGAINNNGSALYFYGSNSKLTTLSGVVSGSGLLKIRPDNGGTHKVRITGASTFTGNVEIDEGEFWIGENGTMGSGTIYIGDGGVGADIAKLWISDANGGTTVSRNMVVNAGDSAENRTIGGLNTSGENTFSGTLDLSTDEAAVDASSGGTVTFSGVISGGNNLVKNGLGTVKLGAANTFSGTLYINAGVLELTDTTDPLDASGIQLGFTTGSDAATLQIGANNVTVDNAVTVRSGSSGTAYIKNNFAGAGTFSSTVTLNKSVTLSAVSGATLTFDGIISGDQDVVLNDAGTVKLTAENTFGTTSGKRLSINKGTLELNRASGDPLDVDGINIGLDSGSDTATLKLQSSSGFTLDQVFVVRQTAGTKTLSNTGGNNTINGNGYLDAALTIDVSGGSLTINKTSGELDLKNQTLTVQGANNTIIGSGTVIKNSTGAGGITKAGAGTLTLSGNNTFSGGVNQSSSGGRINIGHASGLGSGTYTIASGNQFDNSSGGALAIGNALAINAATEFVGANPLTIHGGVSLGGGNRTLTVSGSTLTLAGVLTQSSGSRVLTKAGAGALALTNANTHGGTTLSAGTLHINHAQALGASGTLTLSGGTIDNTSGADLTVGVNYPITMDGSFTYAGSVPRNLNLGTGAVTLSGANRTVTVSAGALTLGGVIDDGASTFKLTKSGAGTLTLTGANTYGGGTTLDGGTLNINNAQALGAAGTTFTIQTTGSRIDNTSGGDLTLSGNYPMIWAIGFEYVGSVPRNLNLGTGGVTLSGGNRTVTVTAGELTVGGIIANDGSARKLTKAGAGTLTLSGVNTFTGGVDFNTGTLNINNAQALGTTAGTFTISGGTLNNTSGADITTLDYPMSWSGDFAFTGTKNLNLGLGNTTLSASRTVTVNGGILAVGGVIDSAGIGRSLTKAGSGTLTLGGANTYLGGTTLSAGTLNINHATAIGSGKLTISGASTIDNTSGSAKTLSNNNTQDWNADFTFTGASDLNLGTGAVALGANRQVTVSAGTLTVGGAISGSSRTLTKAGGGVLSLGGTCTYNGATTVSVGTLLVSGSIANSAVSVSSGATLAGAGTVGSIASLAGTVSPGNTAGVAATLNVSGAAALGGGTFTCDITGLTSTDCDKISASGAVAAGSLLTINLPTSAPSGFDQLSAYTWTIMSGSSASAVNMEIGTKWAASGFFTVQANGNTIEITYSTTAVPTFVWDAEGGSGDRDWSTAANWTADTEPVAASNAFIGNNFTGVVTQAGEVAADLFVGLGSTGTLLQTAGSLGVTNFFLGFAANAAGVYQMSGGALTVAVNLAVGYAGAATAMVQGADSRVVVGGDIQVGFSNAINRAAFEQGAGTVTVANVYLGKKTATEGRYVLSGGALAVASAIYLADDTGTFTATGRLEVTGGRLDATDIFVGRHGHGVMAVGGTAEVHVNGSLADVVIGTLANNNRSNQLTVSGGLITVGDNIELGKAGSTYGNLLVSGGTLVVTGQLLVADAAGSTGEVVVTGGDVNMLESLIIGNAGAGRFSIHGGSVTGSIIRLADLSTGAGAILTVGGGRLVASGTSDFEIDFSGTATVTGGVLEAHDVDLGLQDGALATLNLGGAGTVRANNPFNVGQASGATGVVMQTGGTLDLVGGSATFNVGVTAGSAGFYTITNGTITTDHGLVIGSGSTGTGVFSVVGAAPSITIGDGTTEDLTLQAGGELQVAIAGGLAPLFVQDDLLLGGTLTITNLPTMPGGSYLVATSLNASAVTTFFAATNWLGNRTGTVSYANGAVVLIMPALADADVRGNNTLIADGDATPDPADDTDFGAADTVVGAVTHTFTITNTSLEALGVGNVTTSGAAPADFRVIVQPAASVAIGGTTTFQVTFDPAATGTRTAVLSFTNNINSAKNPYDFHVQGTGTVPEIAVSGNGTDIADGDGSPSTADHTDFGDAGLVGATLARTFTITNSGNGALAVGNVTTGGTQAAEFVVTVQPSASLAPEGTTSFTVEFNPSALGLRQATLSVPSDDFDENPFNFSIQGTGKGAGILNFPTALSFSSTLGTAPAAQAFSITNAGLGTLAYALTTNAEWLTVMTNAASVAAGAGQVHTAVVAMAAALQPGTSNATIEITDAAATNSPKFITVSWIINAIPNPTAQTATADGRELVQLAWTPDGTYGTVLVVHQAGSAPGTPANGTSYVAGNAIPGGGTVIYKGTAAALDHIAAPGATHHYKFFSINSDFYSAGAAASATPGSYQSFEIVDQVAYTNGTSLDTRSGGQGFTNAWSVSAGSWTAIPNDLTALAGFPAAGGNSMTGAAAGTSGIYRGIPEVTAGRLYVAYQLRVTSGGGYAGLSFYDGGNEQVFFGEGGGAVVNQVTVDGQGGNLLSSRELANHTDYTIIGQYDFDNNKAKILLFTNGVESVPAGEPGAWHAEITDGDPAKINRIRIQGDVGMLVDEIRIATNWPNLFAQAATYPAVTNFTVNGGSPVTDAQVTSGVFTVVAHLYDAAGVESTNGAARYFRPNFDLLNTNGVVILSNEAFEFTNYVNGGATLILTDLTHTVVAAANVTLGTYTGRVSAINSNGNAVVDVRTNLFGGALTFSVVDDDSAVPQIVTHNYGESSINKPLRVVTNGTAATRAELGSNTVWTVVDGYLRELGTNTLDFSVGLTDPGSGVSRSSTSSDTNAYLSISIGGVITNRITNFFAAASSTDLETSYEASTNVFRFITPFSPEQVETFYAAGTNNPVRFTVPDADADRPGDQATLHAAIAGYLRVADDDTTAPDVSNFRVRGIGLGGGVGTVTVSQIQFGGWSITGRVEDAGSGVNVNGTTTIDPANNISPFFTLISSTGQVLIAAQVFTNIPFGDGGAMAISSIGMENVTNMVALEQIPLGIYTAQVTVADNDADRPGNDERATLVSNIIFEVVDDPPSLKVVPGVLNFAANLAQNPSPAFQTAMTTNPSATDTSFTNVIAYGSGASGWLTVAPVSMTVTSLTKLTLTASVSCASLPRGTYHATNYLEGASTQLVVTLVVTGYSGGVTYDTFSGYSGVIDGESGGTGWSGSWTRNDTIPEVYIEGSSLVGYDNYCSDGGDKAALDMSGGTATQFREAYREFNEYTNGVIYFGFKFTYQFGATDKEAGIRLMDSGSERLKIGKVAGSSDKLCLGYAGVTNVSSYDIFAASGDYLILGRYDFASGLVRVKGHIGGTVSVTEPSVWDVDTVVPVGTISRINRLSLFARNGGGGQNVGVARWDDVRISTTWNDLLCGVGTPQSYPSVTNAIFLATATDAALASSNFPVALNFVDLLGLESTNAAGVYTVPNFDLFTSNGVQLIQNQPFTGFVYGASGRMLTTSNDLLTVTVNPTNIWLGTNYLRWSAASSNQGYRYDNPFYSNGTRIVVNVVDDDPFTNGPTHELLYIGTNYQLGVASTNVTDADLADGGKLDVALLITDPSGVWVTNSNGAQTTDSVQGNVTPNWDLTNAAYGGFTADQFFTNYYGFNGFGSITAVAYNVASIPASNIVVDSLWYITVSSQDDDKDRGTYVSAGNHTVQVDRAVTTNQTISFAISDDDSTPPFLSNITYAAVANPGSPFIVATNNGGSSTYLVGRGTGLSSTNVTWEITDAELWRAGTRGLTFGFGAGDAYSGINRGTSGTTNTVMNFRIGTIYTNDFSHYSPALSSGSVTGRVMTNVWAFSNGDFGDEALTALVATNQAVPVYVNVPDLDSDRTNDAAMLYNAQAGFIRVLDDDVDAYPVRTLTVNGQAAALLATGFENGEGWTNDFGGSGDYVTNDVVTPDGTWLIHTMQAERGDDISSKRSQSRKITFRGGAPNAYLQLPAKDNPGAVSAWMRNSSGTGANLFTVDYWPAGGSDWVNAGWTNTVNSTNYTLYSWNIDHLGAAVTVRIYAVSMATTNVYLDDLALTRYLEWTNLADLALGWANPTADVSGVYQYRYAHAPGTPPATTTSGSAAPTNGATVSGSSEGIVTGFVFMVDNDGDRTSAPEADRTMGMVVPYRPRIDLTPPSNVTGCAVNTNVADPESELQLTWSGPSLNAGHRSDGALLSPWDSYVIYYTDGGGEPTTNSPSITRYNGPSDLNTNTTTSIILSNLAFDSEYHFRVAGRDRAGNVGELSATVTGATEVFVVTQSVVRLTNEVDVAWRRSSTGAVYDVIWQDGVSWSDSLTNAWQLMSTVTNNTDSDAGGVGRVNPYNLGNAMRFYRVARHGQWETTNLPRRASREIYVAKAFNLQAGENWLSLHAVPDDNRLASVFGTNRLPTGSSPATATRISLYGGATMSGQPVKTAYLSDSKRWIFSLGGTGVADAEPVPLSEGFLLELPAGAPPRQLLVVGELTTNVLSQTVVANGALNMLSLTLPRQTLVRNIGLTNMGFRGAPSFGHVSRPDELRVLNNTNANGSMTSPSLRIWLNSANGRFYNHVGNLDVPANDIPLSPNDVLIWWNRGTTPQTWTVDPADFYTRPSKNIAP